MGFLDYITHVPNKVKTTDANGNQLLSVQIAEKRIKRLDQLALERTYLANHRTLLAYWRTSFSIWLTALAMFKFFEDPFFFYAAIAATIAGFVMLIRGIRYYRKEKDRIRNS